MKIKRNALKDWMMMHCMTYKELADKTGMSESGVWRLVNTPQRRPQNKTIGKLHRLMGDEIFNMIVKENKEK